MKTLKFLVRTTSLVILVLVLSINAIFAGAAPNHSIFLPFVEKNARYGYGADSKFIGIYMQHYWTDNAVTTYMPVADNLAGKKHSVTGWFISFQNIAFTSRQNDLRTNNFYRQLEALWNKGYVSFVNIPSAIQSSDYEVSDNCPIPFSAYQVAHGNCDAAIQKMADLYHQWVSLGGGRIAFLAPLPEMNGVNVNGQPWTSYGGDAANFKLAYQRIQNIFASKGVSSDQVWWSFTPNGWSKPGHEFENYYPWGSIVDVVGFSMYNYGWCWVASPWEKWENYDTLYAPYIARIQSMSPNKPIIIAQTGTTAQYGSSGSFNVEAKNNWLRANYQYLSSQPQVLGILYYDYDQSSWECNWRITDGNAFQPGYRDGASFSAYRYLSWQDLQSIIP